MMFVSVTRTCFIEMFTLYVCHKFMFIWVHTAIKKSDEKCANYDVQRVMLIKMYLLEIIFWLDIFLSSLCKVIFNVECNGSPD